LKLLPSNFITILTSLGPKVFGGRVKKFSRLAGGLTIQEAQLPQRNSAHVFVGWQIDPAIHITVTADVVIMLMAYE